MVFLIMPFFLFAQQDTSDTLRIDSLINSTTLHLSKSAFDLANENANAALNASESIKDWDRWYKSFDRLAYVYLYQGKFDSLKIQSLHFLDKIKDSGIEPVVIAKLHGWVGYASFYIGDNENYMNSNLESARIYESLGQADKATSAYINLGVSYTMKGDYKNASQYLHQAETNALEQNLEQKFYNIWINLGRLYWAQKSIDKAIEYYEKAKNVQSLDFNLSNNLAACYRDKSDLKRAKEYLDISKSLVTSRQDSFKYFMELGKLTRFSDSKKALDHFQMAIELGKDFDEVDRDLAQCHLAIADLQLDNKNIRDAKDGYVKALQLLDTTTYRIITENLNSVAINDLSVLNGPWIMEAIYGLARTEMISPNAEKEKAYKYFERCYDVIDYIRLNFNSEESSLILGDYVRKIYQSAMSFAVKAENKSHNFENKDFILTSLERSRSFLLATNLNEIKAKKTAQIPDSLITKQKVLREQIALHDTGKEKVSESVYFSWVRELEELTNYYREKYPSYYALTRSSIPIQLAEVRAKHLTSNQALIYYFEMPELIYQIGITENSFKVYEIPLSQELLQNCSTFNRILSQRGSSSEAQSNFEKYVGAAQYIYQQLIGKFLSDVSGEGINELTILPDGITHKIVFEALIEKLPEDKKVSYHPNTLDYLIEQYSVSYSYATELNQLENEDQRYAENFIGFAPQFESASSSEERTCTPEGLYNLKYSTSEVEDIQKTMGGIYYTGLEANKAAFLDAMNSARIVHLATHACVDESSPDLHKIFFTNKEYLNSAELYNVNSQAEMVVLSACETGLGQYHSGEGVLSLARTFAYAGIPSVVMSLWSLPDRSTSDIMKIFYKELKSKQPKHIALQQAKLKYLEEAEPANQHPHYWAALVLVGDTEVVEGSGKYGSWLSLVILVVVFFIFGYYLRRKIF